MNYTVDQLRVALTTLEAERRHVRCKTPRVDEQGHSRRPLQVRKGVTEDVPYGGHGYAYLQIDPDTLKVRCGACAGDVDATVKAVAS